MKRKTKASQVLKDRYVKGDKRRLAAIERERCAKKPRTLNAVWADAKCVEVGGLRDMRVQVDTWITAAQALRLSQWLAEAAAWKAEE